MRESSTIKLPVKFHALYHIKFVSAGRKVVLSPVKQKVDFCIIICPKRKSSVHHSSRTWVARARWSKWRWSMKPKAIFDFTTHLPAKMPPKWDLSLHSVRKECVFKTCDWPPKWTFLCIAPGNIMPSKPVTCNPKHALPANESETKTLTLSPPLSTWKRLYVSYKLTADHDHP